jgi:predicted nucleic acid-binding protein
MIEKKPALTPKQWEEIRRLPFEQAAWRAAGTIYGRHATAAVALNGEPFGFTWEDVEILRASTEDPEVAYVNYHRLRDLAVRIEALLPPRE